MQRQACKRYRKKVGMITQENYCTMKNGGKEKQEDHSTSVAYCVKQQMQSSLLVILFHHFLQQGSLLVFASLLYFCTFYRSIPTCGRFYRNFLLLVTFVFFLLFGSKLTVAYQLMHTHYTYQQVQQYFLLILILAYMYNCKDTTMYRWMLWIATAHKS